MSEIIFGIHAVQALLERDPQRFQEVFILKGRDDRRLQPVVAALEAQGVVIQLAERKWLDSQVEGGVHQGIVARVKPGRQYQEGDLPDLLRAWRNPSCWYWTGSPIRTIWVPACAVPMRPVFTRLSCRKIALRP